MVRIFIADDHPIVRRGLAEIISQENDFKVVGEGGNVNEVFEGVAAHSSDILLLDLNMPGKPGLEAIKDLLSRFQGLKILVMSAYPEDQFAKRVLRAGASGYLPKGSAPEQLVAAIRKVSGGGKFVTPAIAEQLATDLGAVVPAQPHETLSDRELQVLLQLSAGTSISDIAEILSLSPKTVSTYRMRILEKLNLKSNAELTRYAIEHKLID